MAAGKAVVLLLGGMILFTVSKVNATVKPTVSTNTVSQSYPSNEGLRQPRKTFWIPDDDFCYRYIQTAMKWSDAEVQCQSLAPGAHLASVHSKNESKFLNKLVAYYASNDTEVWIGASDLGKSQHFQWTDGTLLDFEKWYTGQPKSTSDHCVSCNYNNFREAWGVTNCDRELPFVCKLPQVANITTSILLLCRRAWEEN